MAIGVQCDECHAEYRIKDELAGRSLKCKKCGARMQVPVASSVKPDQEPPPARKKQANKAQEASTFEGKSRPAPKKRKKKRRPKKNQRSPDEQHAAMRRGVSLLLVSSLVFILGVVVQIAVPFALLQNAAAGGAVEEHNAPLPVDVAPQELMIDDEEEFDDLHESAADIEDEVLYPPWFRWLRSGFGIAGAAMLFAGLFVLRGSPDKIQDKEILLWAMGVLVLPMVGSLLGLTANLPEILYDFVRWLDWAGFILVSVFLQKIAVYCKRHDVADLGENAVRMGVAVIFFEVASSIPFFGLFFGGVFLLVYLVSILLWGFNYMRLLFLVFGVVQSYRG